MTTHSDTGHLMLAQETAAPKPAHAVRVLIVQSNQSLGAVWQSHLERQGHAVSRVVDADGAIGVLQRHNVDVIILDVVLDRGCALAVADFASYRRPSARVIFVTNTTFFSDGSIFQHVPNAAAFVQSATPVDDLSVLVEHHGLRAAAD